MSEEVFYKGLRKRTTARFGHTVNPHLFRDCAATSIAIEDPVSAVSRTRVYVCLAWALDWR